MMKKEELIERYGEAAYEKKLEQTRAWNKAHRAEMRASDKKYKKKHPEVSKKYREEHREEALNLGAGNDIRDGWCNVDIRSREGIDIVCDVSNLPFGDNSIGKIYAADVLEHIMYANVPKTLKEWYRVLVPGGVVTIKSPSMSTIATNYVRHMIDTKEFVRLVYGGQEEGDIANAHKSGFDPEYLSLLMKKAGLTVSKIIAHPDPPDQNNMIIKGLKK